MMKRILFSILVAILAINSILAQATLGINYQAVARDPSGQILANKKLTLKFSFATTDKTKPSFYSEVHEITTDELGLISLVVGEGQDKAGAIADIPWATEQIWLDVAMDATGGRDFTVLGSTEFQTVPYAFHAATVSQIVDESSAIDLPIEKNQSIYWTTGGNTNTRPETHFVGTRDAQNIAFKTFAKTRLVLTSGGQLQIYSGVGTGNAQDGDDEDIENYALTIEGSHQGIWIKVNGQRSMDNNFMTFEDDDDVWGEIEGQTLDELKASSEYQNQIALFTLQAVSLAAGGIAMAIEVAGLYAAVTSSAASLFFIWQTPGWAVAAGAATANLAILLADAISFGIEVDNWIENTVEAVGVSYSSGAGDYAEWLKRDKAIRDLYFGEIVGIHGGLVSLNTQDAQHVMVVSKQPIVLGNAPQAAFKHLYEKIAFMGQVPVKVVGKVDVGDYIIPSGNNDGLGIAVNPKDMKIADFSRIVGVAWEAAKDAPLNYVNVGVGLKSNKLAPKVDELSKKVDNIIAYLEGREALVSNNATASTANVGANAEDLQTSLNKQFSDEQFDQMIDLNAPVFKQAFAEAKARMIAQGYDFSARPELSTFLDDPIATMKKLRRDPNLLTQWAMVDKKIQSELKKR